MKTPSSSDIEKNILKSIETFSMNDQLPSVPTAKGIVEYVANNIDSLAKDNNCSGSSLIKPNHKWTSIGLTDYIRYHLSTLNDGFMNLIQETIGAFFSGRRKKTTTDCTTLRGAIPKATTMVVSSFEFATVFSLQSQDLINKEADIFQEGAVVLLLPELKTPQGQPSIYNKLILISKNAMMGKIIHATKSKSNIYLSIHINSSDMSRMNWSRTYTLIIGQIKATPTLPVMEWLHKEYADPNKGGFSAVLTPRILAASNKLSDYQLTAWDNSLLIIVDKADCPSYLSQAEIDISCIIEKEGSLKARPGVNIWPRQTEHLYIVTKKQLEAIRFAMCHHIAAITGVFSTENTYIVGKLALLMVEALDAEHEPLLVLTNTQSTLDTILSDIVEHIPEIVTFGSGQSNNPVLLSKQVTKLTTSDINDDHFKHWERRYVKNQTKLNALYKARYQILEHDPEILCTTTSPINHYRSLKYTYQKHHRTTSTDNLRLRSWIAWTASDIKTKNFAVAQGHMEEMKMAQYILERSYLNKMDRKLMPIFEANQIQNKFIWIAENPVRVSSIIESINWPFTDSSRTGGALRYRLNNVWKRIPTEELWRTPIDKRTIVIDALADVLVDFIDQEIQDIIQDQLQAAKEFDDLLTQKWKRLCRHNRVIGLTADFAAAHRNWISTLGIRAVIVDEASDILESTLVSSLFSSSTEHVVLFGKNDDLQIPNSSSEKPKECPRHNDISLFKRWVNSGGEFVSLD